MGGCLRTRSGQADDVSVPQVRSLRLCQVNPLSKVPQLGFKSRSGSFYDNMLPVAGPAFLRRAVGRRSACGGASSKTIGLGSFCRVGGCEG